MRREGKTGHRQSGEQPYHHDLQMGGAIGTVNRMVHHRTPAWSGTRCSPDCYADKRLVFTWVPHVVSRRGGVPRPWKADHLS